MRPIALVRDTAFSDGWGPFLDDSKRLVLVGDWITILNPKLDKGGRVLVSRIGVKSA